MAALIRKNIFRNGAVSHSNLKISAAQLVSYRGFTSKLFVKGVSFSTTEEMLADAFSQFGQVTEATIITDKGKNRSKGYGYVTFSTEEEAQNALTEMNGKEIECMVMEVSRAEYLAGDNLKQQLGHKESSTSGAEPSSSGARSSCSETKLEGGKGCELSDTVLSSSMQMVLSMGFSYLQVIEAYSIFGDDVDSMVCYLLETGSSSRRKGKATE